MAKNDTVLIDSLLQQMAAENPAIDIGEHFERFVLEQVLKNFDLAPEEIDFGWTDGSHDGGIDGLYVFINGRLLTDPEDFSWPRSGAEIQVFLVTCKHRPTFQQAPLDAMLASVQELFDLSKPNSELSGKYSSDIKRCRDMFVAAFRQLSLHRPLLAFNVIYACRGESSMLGESIQARANQLTDLLNSYFSGATAEFSSLGSTELVELYRQVKSFALDLPVQECLTAGNEGYVVLSRLNDYCEFVQDEKGKLRRYLFDSNVRAFLGANLVNADIAETLAGEGGPNFWWLNNGVTILATSASLVGKTLKLRDIQIVNGLQTTESVHRHFSRVSKVQAENRSLLVKVIVSGDDGVRDQVIRATNNQSTVEPAALHATDRIQRNIEEILLRHDWYYERRTNFHKNEGRSEARIISPLALASGAVALLLRNPAKSSKLRQKHLRTTEAYGAVYADHFPLKAWPTVAHLIRAAENAIVRKFRAKNGAHGQPLSAWRGTVAFFTMARLSGTLSFDHQNLTTVDLSIATDAYVDECLEICISGTSKYRGHRLGQDDLNAIAEVCRKSWALEGNLVEGRRSVPGNPPGRSPGVVDEDLLVEVNKLLPEQPWKPGVHQPIASKLGIRPLIVSKAIQTLMARGTRFVQRDGVVFDKNGEELLRDPTRFPE